MAISVYTDASYHISTKRGAYAIHIEGDEVSHRLVGRVDGMDDPLDCELHAVYIASAILNLYDYRGLVIFWIDSVPAIMKITKEHTDGRPLVKEILNITNFSAVYNYLPRNSHVQHKWCDTKAKELLA